MKPFAVTLLPCLLACVASADPNRLPREGAPGDARLAAEPRPDLVVADFEGDTYGDWKTTGTAFGPGPARGTLPNQMPVTGFLGRGLANSYHGGDDSTGTLTSPPFTVERPYLNFLVGGGKYPGETCVNLLLDGQVVRTATGPNDRPGGSEQLDWRSWDVKELAGKKVVIEIVDRRKGGWGHVCVDHIVQSDRPRQAGPVRRDLAVSEPYLLLPVKNGAAKRRLTVRVDDRVVRDFDIELADGEPDFLVFCDVSAFKGKTLRLETQLPAESKALEAVRQSGEAVPGDSLYREKYRPQFHFTARRGWLNDPNGLVFFRGEYHLFFQHNPYGREWGNMHWGHAVSPDLVHWRELPVALYPAKYGDWAFSGSAVVDAGNTSGFGTRDEPPLVAAFTSTGRGECIVYSTDRGRGWREHDGNPVVKHAGRDPRLLWHEASRRWVMAVYDEHDGKQWIAFHTSPDLKKWTFASRIEGFFECPDLFELPVEGKEGERRWVLYAADGRYVVGAFDGKTFTPEGGKHTLWYGNFYAAQTFSDAPDGRRVQIGWARGVDFPGMPFNQQMTVPCRLSLRATPDGPRLFAEPVREMDRLHARKFVGSDRVLRPGDNLLDVVGGGLLDVRVEFDAGQAESFGFRFRGVPVTYDVAKQTLTCNGVSAPLRPVDGRVRLRILVDRGSVEAFGQDGAVAVSAAAIPPEGRTGNEVFSRGGPTKLVSLEVFELRSAWPER